MRKSITSAIAALCACASFAAEDSRTVRRPGPWHHVNNRAYTGIASIAASPKNGRLWAAWYAGVTPGEDSNNYVVLATSADRGRTWKEVLVADPDGLGPRRAFDPQVWVAPDGRLRWTWTERTVPLQARAESAYAGCHADPRSDDLMMATLNAEDEPPADAPQPARIGRGVMTCKPFAARDGSWMLPVAHWREEPSACVLSTTNGTDFAELGGAVVPKGERLYDENIVVQSANGTLQMLVRTRSGISEAQSKDGGRTWSKCEASGIGHPSARLFMRRLASGRILLVKHGAIGENAGRERLMAFLSEDDGVTWQGGLLLDGRSGVSYPDGDQLPDGTIAVVYDYSRTRERLICMAMFAEEDVLAGRNASGRLSLHRVVSCRVSSDPEWKDVDPRLGRSVSHDGATLWIDGGSEPRGGRVSDSAAPYARLPRKTAGDVSPEALGAAQDSAGISFRFSTGATNMVFEWSLLRAPAAPPQSLDARRNGIDVYARGEKGGWAFVENGPASGRFGNRMELGWKPERECLVYLPAANGVREFRIGVPRGASFVPPTPVAERPIVFYGADNFQGAAASRPGLALPSVVGRALDAPVVNFGFSGAKRVDPAFLEILCSIDAAAYVFDSSWGGADAQAKDVLDGWARELKARRPDAAVVFASDFFPRDGDAFICGGLLNDFGIVEWAHSCVDALRRAGVAGR